MSKYVSKRIYIPSLKLDFDLICKEEDASQLDIYMNLLLSLWKQEGRDTNIEVLDHVSHVKNHRKSTVRDSD
jgi:hypothetical protein